MPYPDRNTSTPTFASKNSASFSVSDQSGQNFLEIGEGFTLLIEDTYKLLLEPNSADWSYATKN